MADKILIITQDGDAHVPFVEKHLTLPTLTVDPSGVTKGKELSYDYHDGKLHISFDGTEIDEIRSVWYRKPLPIWGDMLPVEPDYRRYSETAILALTRELYTHFSDAFWMSDYYAIRRADHKGLQMAVAAKLGFNIPDTIITSDATKAKAFINSRPETVVKSLASTFPNLKSGDSTMFFTQLLHPGEERDFSGLHMAPALFQTAIDFVEEYRVTVVGDKVFTAAVHAKGMEDLTGIRDWRPAHFHGEIDFKAHQLDKELEEQCIALIRKLGLTYGAIDLLKDKSGKIWFLENNPNGQWAFVEDVTGQPIGKAIAECLDRGNKD
jgi:glutathione synthase/RimK-type ligase-like ATP-grasp enzyme